MMYFQVSLHLMKIETENLIAFTLIALTLPQRIKIETYAF
jgi:hypothetical protein